MCAAVLPQNVFLSVVEDIQANSDTRSMFFVRDVHGAKLDAVVFQACLEENAFWFYVDQVERCEEVLEQSAVDFSELVSCLGAGVRVLSLFGAELHVAEEKDHITES